MNDIGMNNYALARFVVSTLFVVSPGHIANAFVGLRYNNYG